MTVWLLWLTAFLKFCGPSAAAEEFFCMQFFEHIKTRTHLDFSVNDSSPPGTVIAQFKAPRDPRENVFFLSEDVDFVGLQDYRLQVQKDLRPRNGDKLLLEGRCNGNVVPYNVIASVEFNITVDVTDTNDVPVFINLPGTIDLYENVTVGTVVYNVEVDDSFDLDQSFWTKEIIIDQVTALETSRPSSTRTFYASGRDGNIRLIDRLDYEMGPRIYKVKIKATDGGDPPKHAIGRLVIRVLDVNDMPPKFSRDQYVTRVIGEKPLMGKEECFNITPPISAVDQDRQLRSDITYDIIEGEPGTRDYWGDYFRLEPNTGMLCQLSTIRRLLRDPVTQRDVFFNFTFTIRAYETGYPQMYDTSQLHIHVMDSNGYSPTFERKLYRKSLPEHPVTTEGTKIVQVEAHDKDYGQNSEFSYSLLSNPEGMFTINVGTGEIFLAKDQFFDRERMEFIELKIRAKEIYSVDQYEDTSRVLINLIDVNDNAPTFTNVSYRYTVKDTLQPRRPIHSFEDRPEAFDADSGDNGHVVYTISGVWREGSDTLFSDLGRFMIDQDTGVISLASSINDLRRKRDYPRYRLEITATDRARNPRDRLSGTAGVFVNIEKANEHKPQFVPPKHTNPNSSNNPGHDGRYHVYEDEPIGTVVTHISAEDGDGDEDVFLVYWISQGDDQGMFSISSDGRLSLRRQLDREDQAFYKLNVSVTDGHHNVSTLVGVFVDDINDNVPQFERDEYDFHVDEDVSPGSVIGHLRATDLDLEEAGEVTYSLKQGKASDLFSIGKDGSLVIKAQSPLFDREKTDIIALRVIASDNGSPTLKSTADVLIHLNDVNDNRPLFTHAVYSGTIDEDDNGDDPIPRKVAMEANVRATDADATKENRDIIYTMNGTGSEFFTIDQSTGEVLASNPGTLDAESCPEYELEILARDRNGTGLSSASRLLIKIKDKNDNAPVFEKNVDITVPNDAAIGSLVGHVVATDADVTEANSRVIFILKDGGFGKFSVDLETGGIRVADVMHREPRHRDYQLSVQAFDGGIPRQYNVTTVNVHVPLNQPPMFSQNKTRFAVEENRPIDRPLGIVPAIDPDVQDGGQSLTYFVEPSQVYNLPFRVEANSGRVYAKSPLDYEVQREYNFDIYVRDDGYPVMTGSISVTIDVVDVNDQPLVFMMNSYEGRILEDNTNPKPGQIVIMPVNISLVGQDLTDDVTLSLHGNQSGMFYIDGVDKLVKVSVSGGGKIDREAQERFDLILRACDRHDPERKAEVDLTIRIVDDNDNQPMFHVLPHQLYVNEHVKAGEEIGTVIAIDNDATSPNNDIIYVLESDPFGKFNLDLHTGRISVLSGLFFKPRQKTYKLVVAATDLGTPRQTTRTVVTVHVLKENFNDYTPEFLGETILFIDEEQPIGSLVGTLQFVDEDLAPGETVMLKIMSDTPVPFVVDSLTGELKTTSRLDYDVGPHAYTFTVMAMDNVQPPKEAKITVGVIVEDINDNPPRFVQAEYHHRVAYNFPAGTVVATPFAYDDIDAHQSSYRYRLEGIGAGELFNIDPRTGVITTTSVLKQADRDMYEYALYATDIHQSELTAVARLVIDVQRSTENVICDPAYVVPAH